MSAVYFYDCDDGPQWVCDRCGGTALSEFADQDEATVYATRIMRARYAAKMAGLDQAKARLADMERGS